MFEENRGLFAEEYGSARDVVSGPDGDRELRGGSELLNE